MKEVIEYNGKQYKRVRSTNNAIINYIATDSDGQVYGYDMKPVYNYEDMVWAMTGGKCVKLVYLTVDSENSLVEL